MAKMDMMTARNHLKDCQIYRDERGNFPDYYTLSSYDVECILEVAEAVGYRKPRDANGSRGRYFYEHLTRTAK